MRKRAQISPDLLGVIGNAFGGSSAGASDASDDTTGEPGVSVTPGANIPKPNWLQRTFVPGMAQGYQQGQFQLANTALQGQNDLAVQGARNTGAINLANTTSQNAQDLARVNAGIATEAANNAMMRQAGFNPNDPNDVTFYHNTYLPQTRQNNQAGASNTGATLKLAGNALDPNQNPDIQKNFNAGANANASAQFFNNMKNSMMNVGPMQNSSAYGSMGIGQTGQGAMPLGTQTSGTTGFDSATGKTISNSTTGSSFQPGSFGSDLMGGGLPKLTPLKAPASSDSTDDTSNEWKNELSRLGVYQYPMGITPAVQEQTPSNNNIAATFQQFLQYLGVGSNHGQAITN